MNLAKAYFILLKLASVFLSFLLSMVLTRFMSVSEFGLYSVAFSVIMLLSVPSQVGLPLLIVRETARYKVQEKWSLIKGLWKWCNRTAIVMSCTIITTAASVLTILLATTIDVDRSLIKVILVSLPLVFLIPMANLRAGALRGLSRVFIGMFPELLLRNILFIIFVLIATLYVNITGQIAILILILSTLFCLFVGWLLLRIYSPAEVVKEHAISYESERWRGALLPLALVSIVQVANNQSGIVILSVTSDLVDVAILKISVVLSTFMALGLQAINMYFNPRIASLAARNEFEKIQLEVKLISTISFSIALGIFLIFLIFGELLLEKIYGVEYRDAYWPLIALSIGQLVNTIIGPAGGLLNMTGHEKKTLQSALYALISGLGLMFFLSIYLDALGAAIGVAFGLVVLNLSMRYYCIKEIGIETIFFAIDGNKS